MAALANGVAAPDFELKTLDGKSFSLSAELARGPVVLAFFKVSCPTCQYAAPFLERFFDSGMVEEAFALNKEGLVDFPAHFDFVLGVPGAMGARPEALDFLRSSLPPDSTWTVAAMGRQSAPVPPIP